MTDENKDYKEIAAGFEYLNNKGRSNLNPKNIQASSYSENQESPKEHKKPAEVIVTPKNEEKVLGRFAKIGHAVLSKLKNQ